jgi:aldehyde dehydrogenase (NAD+)
MATTAQFYIGGRWVNPTVAKTIEVIDPATEQPFTELAVGSAADVNKAVAAAKRAFTSFSTTTREQRLKWLRALLDAYNARYDAIAEAVS